MFEDHPAHLLGLVTLVQTSRERRLLRALAIGPELLAVALGGLRDDSVGGLEDWSGGAVVAFESDDLSAGMLGREIEDVRDGRRPERIDRLSVVPNHGDVGAALTHAQQDVGLKGVRILILVDEHVIEKLAYASAHRRRGHHRLPEQQEIVVVENALLSLALDIPAEYGSDPFDLLDAPREVSLQDPL